MHPLRRSRTCRHRMHGLVVHVRLYLIAWTIRLSAAVHHHQAITSVHVRPIATRTVRLAHIRVADLLLASRVIADRILAQASVDHVRVRDRTSIDRALVLVRSSVVRV